MLPPQIFFWNFGLGERNALDFRTQLVTRAEMRLQQLRTRIALSQPYGELPLDFVPSPTIKAAVLQVNQPDAAGATSVPLDDCNRQVTVFSLLLIRKISYQVVFQTEVLPSAGKCRACLRKLPKRRVVSQNLEKRKKPFSALFRCLWLSR